MPTPDRIRCVAVLGHSHNGKTSLCEALLLTAGATPRLGSTDQGTSILDHEPEEQKRSISISAAVAHCDWMNVRINLIDTPGFQDFSGEVSQALAASDAAILVVSAGSAGMEVPWSVEPSRWVAPAAWRRASQSDVLPSWLWPRTATQRMRSGVGIGLFSNSNPAFRRNPGSQW